MLRTYPAILKKSRKINLIHYVYDRNIFVEDLKRQWPLPVGLSSLTVDVPWEAMITTKGLVPSAM
jgi:hypothetical protein